MSAKKKEKIANELWGKSVASMGEQPKLGHLPNMWDRLTEARKAKGLTQDEFADLIGVTQTTVSHWETADTLPKSAMPFIKMSMVLDVPLDWLFYNNFVVGSISEEEKATMRKATEILQRLYSKK